MHRYEDLLREAHVAALELSLALRRAQAAAGLSAIAGHALFARFDEAQSHIGAALAASAGGHRLARAFAPLVGVDPSSYGEKTDPLE